ncbi:MAG: hypothetical protein EOO15_07690 [Chitinophagaceae bacterium]|nr:MAG: hypothetical protein EOO15_07690 [Chitinophagaceae bacterium]
MATRISTDPTDAGHYEWQQPGHPAVSLRYNELLHSMRVSAGNERRVFLIESSGSNAPKVELFNEYGLRSATCNFDDSRHLRGTLRWDDQKIRFHEEEGQLVFIRSGQRISLNWSLPPDAKPEAIAGILLMLARNPLSPKGD